MLQWPSTMLRVASHGRVPLHPEETLAHGVISYIYRYFSPSMRYAYYFNKTTRRCEV